MKILITFILSVLLINISFSRVGAETLYHHQKTIIQVSPEKMRSLLNDPEVRRYAQVKTIERDDEKKRPEGDSTPTLNNSGVDVLLNSPTTNGNKEAALIVFAIVGAVVIIAWIPYFIGVSAKLLKGETDQLEFKRFLTAQFTQLTTERNGKLLGARYGFYTIDKEEKTYATYGLSFESGYYDSREKNKEQQREYRHGSYWLVGPSLFFQEGSIIGKTDLLAGSSFDQNLGLVSKAEASLHWKFKSGLMIGASLGGLYFNVKDKYGILNHHNDLGFTYGLVTGLSF